MSQGIGVEGPLPREALIEDDAQRVDVGARIQAHFAADLLGRHVVRRSERGALLRQRHAPGFARVEFRYAEVEDLHERASVLFCDEQVVGLQIAVDDPGLVRGLYAVARLTDEIDDLLDRHRSLPDSIRERAPLSISMMM